jgi:hypothetical protein
LQQPIVTAQAFAVESIADRYAAAQQQVVTQKKINMILSPDAFIWAPDAVDVTKAVTAAIDALPAVGLRRRQTGSPNSRPARFMSRFSSVC